MHRYQLLWTPAFIVLGIDDAPKFIHKNEAIMDSKKHDPAKWPFDNEHHLLLNIAVGGDWGGKKGIDKKIFPAKMEIDYVRVYQLEGKAVPPKKAE